MLFFERDLNGGTQKLYKFENNYGASVVCHSYSYGGDRGLWELAVLTFDGDDWDLTYETPITNDVIGHLEWEEVEDILKRIEELA